MSKRIQHIATSGFIALALLLSLVTVVVPPPTANAADTGSQQMYRMYNPNSGEHFYTANTYERDHLRQVGWNYEGVGWIAPTKSATPVYRLYNPNAGDHHYTMNSHERDNLVRVGWRYEGIGWYSSDTNRKYPLYRQYNPNARAGAHNYTLNSNENAMLVRAGWRAEGIGWYGIGPAQAAPSTAPIGTTFSVNGVPFTAFNPRNGGSTTNGPVKSAHYQVSGKVQLTYLPSGWTADCTWGPDSNGRQTAFYVIKGNGMTYRWWFDGASGITHSVYELRGLKLTINGVAVNCDPTKDVNVHHVVPSDFIGYENAPLEWTVSQGDFNENDVHGYRYILQPNDASSPRVTYKFYFD